MRDMMAGEEPYIFVKLFMPVHPSWEHWAVCGYSESGEDCRRYLSELSLSWRSVSWQHITDGIFQGSESKNPGRQGAFCRM